MIRSIRMIGMFTIIFLCAQNTPAQSTKLDVKNTISIDVAKKIVAAAYEFADKNNWNVNISIVDDGGHLLYFERHAGVQLGSIELAIEKAKTAVFFKRATAVFDKGIADGRNALLSIPDAIILEGGVPIVYNGEVIGAIGVSGVTSVQDGMIAQAGADALKDLLK